MRHFGRAACLLVALGVFAPAMAANPPRRVRTPAPAPTLEPMRVPPLARAVIFDRINHPSPQPVALEVEGISVQVEVAQQQPCPGKAILMEASNPAPAGGSHHARWQRWCSKRPATPRSGRILPP